MLLICDLIICCYCFRHCPEISLSVELGLFRKHLSIAIPIIHHHHLIHESNRQFMFQSLKVLKLLHSFISLSLCSLVIIQSCLAFLLFLSLTLVILTLKWTLQNNEQ